MANIVRNGARVNKLFERDADACRSQAIAQLAKYNPAEKEEGAREELNYVAEQLKDFEATMRPLQIMEVTTPILIRILDGSSADSLQPYIRVSGFPIPWDLCSSASHSHTAYRVTLEHA